MRFVRRLAYAVAITVSVILLTLICLPTIVSTRAGQTVALSIANKCYNGSIAFQDLSLSWISGVDLKGLRITDEQDRELVTCQHFVFEKSLLSLLFSHRDIGSVMIHSPAIYCYPAPEKEKPQHVSHSSSSHKKPHYKSVKPIEQSHPKMFTLPDMKGKIAIDNASIVSMKDRRILGAITSGNLVADLNLLHTSKASFDASLSQGDSPKIPISLNLALQGNQDVSKLQGALHVSCEHIPTEVLAILSEAVDPSFGNLLREAFGSTISYTFDATVEGSKAVAMSKLDSDNVRSAIEASLDGSTITLKEGPFFTGTVTPTLFSSLHVLNAQLAKPASLLIENRSPLSFDINTCNFLSPFNLRLASQNPAQILFDQTTPLTCSFEGLVQGAASSPIGSFVLKASTPDSTADVTVDCSAVDQGAGYHVTSRLSLSGGWPSIASLIAKQSVKPFLGDDLSFTGICEGDILKDGSGFSLLASTDLRTQPIQSKVAFSILKEAKNPSATFSLKATGALQSTQSAPLQELVGSEVEVQCDGSYDFEKQTVSLSKTSVTSPRATLSVNGATYALGDHLTLSSPLFASLQISPAFLKKYSLDVEKPFTLTASVSPFSLTQRKGRWSATKIDAKLQSDTIALSGNQEITVCAPVSVDLQHRECSASLSLTDASNGSDVFYATLSSQLPESYADLTGGVSLQVEGNGTVSPETLSAIKAAVHCSCPISITKPVSFSLSPSTCTFELQSLFRDTSTVVSLLNSATLKANLSLSPLTLCRHHHHLGSLAALEGNVTLNGPSHSLSFALSTPRDQHDGAINMDIQGTCEDLWNQDGFTPPLSRINTSVTISEFPTRLIELAMPDKGELLEKAVGKTVRLTGFASIEKMKTGAVKFDLTAKHCSVHIDGLIQDGALSLKAPATASLEVTEKAGALLLKDVNPLLATALSSKQPLRLSIDPAGAFIPLSPFSLAAVRLPKITADVGQLVVKNGGALKIILALLGLGKAASADTVDLWLTPVYLRLEKGMVTCQRTDALAADKLHIITWGTIDLNHDTINMIMAIPQDCLQQLHIEILTTTPERGLQIPVTGSSTNPNIETKRVTAKLAGAGMYVSRNAHAALIGGLLQAAAAVGSDDQPIPPPTTQPFPWTRR